MSRRRVNPDELELWRRITHDIRRQTQDNGRESIGFPLKTPKETIVPPEPKQWAQFELGSMAPASRPKYDLLPGIREQLEARPVAMDKRALQRLKRGQLLPEARIDLHGMTLDQAHSALSGFILRSHAEGRRLVLVITGKGKDRDTGGPIPLRHGVLRHNVPQWRAAPPLASLVLQMTQAHKRHGGEGAYYVYLRRQK